MGLLDKNPNSFMAHLPEILQIIGAATTDISYRGRTDNLSGVIKNQAERRKDLLAQQQAQALAAPFTQSGQRSIQTGVGPPIEVDTPPSPNSRAYAPTAAGALANGADPEMVKAFTGLAGAYDPSVQYDRGFGYDAKDAGQAGKFHPDIPEGATPLYDAQGNIAAYRNMDGAVQAAREMARAKAQPMNVPQGDTVFDPSAGAPIYTAPRYQTLSPGENLVEVSPGQGGGAPRGVRNNNPGNIKDGPFARNLPGYQGADKDGFAVFSDPAAGRGGQMSLLRQYGSMGLNTPQAIISRWAPPSDNNPTQAYAQFVAGKLGVRPDQPLNMNDPATLNGLADAIGAFEGGQHSASNSTGQPGSARTIATGAPKQGYRPASPEEKAGYGIPPDVPAQVGPDGRIDVVSGTGANLKPVPPQIQSGLASNRQAIGQIDATIAAIKANPKALGLKNFVGDEVAQRLDPGGVTVRAKVANIGALKRHEVSGAAVTAAEAPYLKPFIPAAVDTADAAIRKLQSMKEQFQNANSEMETQYGSESGYRPLANSSAAPQRTAAKPPPKLGQTFNTSAGTVTVRPR